MYVTVHSNVGGWIYRSMVYAQINIGAFMRFVVYNPHQNRFELIKYIEGGKPNVYVIRKGDEEFVRTSDEANARINAACSGTTSETVNQVLGYPDVCENEAFLCDLWKTKSVERDRYSVSLRDLPDVNEWNYIRTQEEADDFMDLFAGFHDATLDKVCYREDWDGTKEATVIFDNSAWFGVAELCFEGVIIMRIQPAGENYTREIMDGVLFANDAGVYWADGCMEKPDDNYQGSFIRALSLKWRKITTSD